MSLVMHCDNCDTDTPSELGRWDRWYSRGEIWSETCTNCGTVYYVELTTKRSNRSDPKGAPAH